MQSKKIGFWGCLAAGIGCIIGSGIFGSLPTVAQEIGGGVIWALFGAAFVVVLRSISRMYATAALPTSASQFMHATKLIHPCLGALISINAFLIPSMIALFGVLFSSYFLALFPNCPLSSTAIGILMVIFFAVLAWFGNRSTVSVNNLLVATLLVAIALYIIFGLPNLDAANLNFSDILRPAISLNAFSAAVGVLTSSLSGASAVAEIADDVDRPGRNVPLTLALCPLIVCVIYVLMSVVTLGIVPSAELETLAQVAERFLSPGLLTFFIVGGPIAGVITSMIPVALSNVAVFEFSAKNRVFPQIMAKQNRHGVSYISLLLVAAISIGIIGTGATFGPIMTVFSFSNTVAELPNTLMPIFAYRKYPKSCSRSFVKLPIGFMRIVSVLTFIICVYLSIQMAMTMEFLVWITLLTVYAAGYLYFFLRVRYLKNKESYNLIQELQTPFTPWEEREHSL